MTATTATGLLVRPLTVRIGAEIIGADAAGDLEQATIDGIRAALLEHKVVFLRGQEIDDEQQLRFARRFGPLTAAHPTVPGLAAAPNVFELDSHAGGRADHWHTDVTFTDRPPAISILHAVVVPEVGGDTVWANTETAYDHLPEPLRQLAGSLRAVHTNAYDYAKARETSELADGPTKEHREHFISQEFETEHPVVRVHPETRRPSLLLGGFARHLVGLSSRESAEIIRIYQDRATGLENIVRWRWQAGDVAIWDNRATQHYAVNDYGDAHRVVRRTTVAGSVPVGLDGRPSLVRRGDASAYSDIAQ